MAPVEGVDYPTHFHAWFHGCEFFSMTTSPVPLPDEPVDDMESGDCYWCGGDGWEECDDPIQCLDYHNQWGEHRCGSCGGSGRAKDMTIW